MNKDVDLHVHREEIPKEISKYQEMINAEKNIPYTRAEMKALPLGFTETSAFPTKAFKGWASKYLPVPKPKFIKNV